MSPPDLAERLRCFLADREPGRRPVIRDCRPISGGYSRLSAVADVDWGDGVSERLVLRADPPPGEGVFFSDRHAEWALLQALRDVDTVSVATPRYYDGTGMFFGTPCMVVEFVGGRPLQAVAAEGDRDAVTDLFVGTIADVHATPLGSLPERFRTPPDFDSYLDQAAEVYLRVEREVADSSPILRYVADVLRRHRPPPVRSTLVHGDCQPANVLVGPDRAPVVIDWEFARVGDPREDLGYYRQIPLEPNLYEADRAGFLRRYRARSGLTEEQLNPAVVDYFLLVGMADLLAQLLRAADAIAGGQRRGILATYLLSAISLQYDLFFSICRRLERHGFDTDATAPE